LIGFFIVDAEIIHVIVVFALFALGLVSIVLEFFLEIYKIVPVDLYGIGMTIVVEDQKLLKIIEMRRREQEEMERKIK
jgi:hypothetical protein